MNPAREEALFALALEKPAEERAAFLEIVCGNDDRLRKRLEVLLAAHEQTDGLKPLSPELDESTVKVEAIAEFQDDTIGTTIGRYKLLEKVGEGGCGVVYVAEQSEPVRRRVALKVIKLGMDTKQVVARFEAERQALAMMDHPNIARVLDAGSTETGRPYFIMELVRGIRITEYCDQNKLSTIERLELFIRICQAIQHAHQKGIIHRDIKPSNILVTLHDGVPVPKVIDFGIAKATEGRLTDATVYTQLRQFIGTPAYMSPEQAEMSGLDVDTRSDIYSLGVLLYELLTGKTPFDGQELMSRGIDEMRKTIREKDPVRPSTRLTQELVAADVSPRKSTSGLAIPSDEEVSADSRRRLRLKEQIARVRGDLDWIVMKCLEKDRTRRYETANGLAADIKRHLSNEPVIARPPSKLYEFQKTVRRHKVGFAATAAIIIVLAVGIAVASWQAVRATHAKKEALAAQASESVQRQKAEANEQKAVEAQASESKLREQAQVQELAARQRAYASDMNVAQQALVGGNLGRALDLLNRQRPEPGQKDLRGWEWRYLWGQTHSDALLTLCQKTEIESLTVSADGRWVAIGLVHKDGLYVYDLQTRQQVAHIAAGEGGVRAAFSPAQPLLAFTSENILASGKLQETLRLWNAETRKLVEEFPLDGFGMGVVFSQDGRTLVTSTAEGSITLWQIPEGTKQASYPCEQQADMTPSTGFAATSDLRLAAYGTRSGQIRVLDLHDGEELWRAVASKAYITALAFSPDGRTLASAAGFGESDIRLWDVATGKETGRLEGHQGWVGSLVFWPDGKKLASSSADQTIRTWDIPGRQCLDVLHGHRLEVWRLALLPDNRTLVSGCKDGTVCVWDTSVTHPRPKSITWPDRIAAWCFTLDGRSVVTLNHEGKLMRSYGVGFQEKETLLEIGSIASNLANRGNSLLWPYSLSPEGRFLACGSTNGAITVWDVSRRSLWREFKPGAGQANPLGFLARGSRLICHTSTENRLSEWDLETNREVQTWPAPALVAAFGLSPDERMGIAAGWNGDVVERDLPANNNTELSLDALEGFGVAFSADGKRLAIASALGFARVWGTATWREEATLGGFLNAVNDVAFSPNGRRLATTGSNPDDAVKLWDVDSWQELLTLEGQGSLHISTAFSPDGNTIGVMSLDGFLHVWQAPSWEEIHAAEAKDPPPPDYGATGNMEGQQP